MSHRVVELHSIMPIINILSVLEKGVLSNEQAAKLKHASIAMQSVQDKRDNVQVPKGLKLHQYANLYFHARNPMLYSRKAEANNFCVLRISTDALSIDGVVITDQNASSDYVRFYSPQQINQINFDMVFAEDWRDKDQISYWRKKAAKCAEVLVPKYVPPDLIFGAYVCNEQVKNAISGYRFSDNIVVSPHMFFL
jgi:hypothetical protein